MQILTRIGMVVTKNYDRMTTMDENANWMKLKCLYSYFSLNLMAPFCISTFTSKRFIAFLDVHTRENIIPLPYIYIMYTNA